MIQQPIQQPILQSSAESLFRYSGNSGSRSWLNHVVSVSASYVTSMIPSGDPCFSINPRQAVLDLARLVTMHCVPASAPAFMVKGLVDVCTESHLPGPDVNSALSKQQPVLVTATKNGQDPAALPKVPRVEAQEKQYPKNTVLQQPVTYHHQYGPAAIGIKGVAVLGALASIGAAGAAHTTVGMQHIINIADAETLGKIGYDPGYPPEGHYQQTANIDASNLNQSIDNFTGLYDGLCHTIANPRHCLVENLGQEGRIENLRFTDANINSTKTTGLVACTVQGTVSGIRVESADIFASGDEVYAGIGGGVVSGTVSDTTAVKSRVSTVGDSAHAGIGGGMVNAGGTISDTTAVNSSVSTEGSSASAGIGGGMVNAGGTVSNTTVVNSRVSTGGERASSGIGAGYVGFSGTVSDTTAVSGTVSTEGDHSYAGIGAGCLNHGTVSHTTAVNSNVSTEGDYSTAGIGVGYSVSDVSDELKSVIIDTTAVNSNVSTEGELAHAGIGGGVLEGSGVIISQTRAVNSHVSTSKVSAQANIVGNYWQAMASNTTSVNSTVNGELLNLGSISEYQLANLCQKADPCVLTAECHFLDSLKARKFSHCNVCLINAETTPLITNAETTPLITNAETTPLITNTETTPLITGAAGTTGIVMGSSLALGGLVGMVVVYSGHQLITGYRDGLRGKALAMKPITRGRELAGAVASSVSLCIQGIRERMTREPVPALAAPAHNMSLIQTREAVQE